MRYLLLILFASIAFAGDAVNPAVKSSLDSYESDVAKAYADYLKTVSKVNDKTTKDLDTKLKAAMKKGDLDLATAIKAQMEEISKGKTRTDLENKWNAELAKGPMDLLGPTTENDTLVGKWGMSATNSWEFKSDGSGTRLSPDGNVHPIKWKKTGDAYLVTIQGQERTLTFQGKDSIQISPGLFPRMK